MKKVLTLVSALSMVAGSAFANDYDWTGLNSPKTDANHNVVLMVRQQILSMRTRNLHSM